MARFGTHRIVLNRSNFVTLLIFNIMLHMLYSNVFFHLLEDETNIHFQDKKYRWCWKYIGKMTWQKKFIFRVFFHWSHSNCAMNIFRVMKNEGDIYPRHPVYSTLDNKFESLWIRFEAQNSWQILNFEFCQDYSISYKLFHYFDCHKMLEKFKLL